MSDTQLLIATRNPGKLKEFVAIFHDLPLRLITLDQLGIEEEIEETGTTFIENARLKAYGYAKLSGMLSLADDSGLEVDALNGEPGVYSAYYAPTPAEYRARVLRQMQNVPEEQRTARFRSVICIVDPAKQPDQLVGEAEGTFEGRIAYEEAGQYGFGYDSIFIVPEYGCTVAQLEPQIKNQISHRSVAAEGARNILETYLQKNSSRSAGGG